MELMVGASNKVNLSKLNKNINRFNILLINPEITTITIQLIENYRLSHNLAMPDALIAATALHTGLQLFTFNVRGCLENKINQRTTHQRYAKNFRKQKKC